MLTNNFYPSYKFCSLHWLINQLPMKRAACLIILIIITFRSNAQLIVNIENSRIHTDTTGLKGSASASFSFIKNTQEVLNINTAAHLQYKTNKDLYLLLASYSLLTGNKQQLTNNSFFHLRYNRKLGKVVRYEVFTQLQQNKITNIDARYLLGTGPRFKLAESEKIKVYLGVLAMYELEKDREPAVTLRDFRGDNYLSFTYLPSSIVTITSTSFYQPLVKQFSDYRFLNQIAVSIKVSERFAVTANWDYLYDTSPALGVPNSNLAVTHGLRYSF